MQNDKEAARPGPVVERDQPEFRRHIAYTYLHATLVAGTRQSHGRVNARARDGQPADRARGIADPTRDVPIDEEAALAHWVPHDVAQTHIPMEVTLALSVVQRPHNIPHHSGYCAQTILSAHGSADRL